MQAQDRFQRYLLLIKKFVGETPPDMDSFKRPSEPELHQFIKDQQPNGAFLRPDLAASPEARWYDEMVILHAVANHATRVHDPQINNAVRKAAEYHLREIQPDHATADPWALLAYIQYAAPLADQVLHAMQMQYPQGITGLPLLLLTDVMYGLQRLSKEQSHEQ